VQLLLEKGAEVNTQARRHGNALSTASLEGYEKVVELLLEKGADVSAQGGERAIALHTVARSRQVYMK
jgi:ankyrin repeat protein